MAGSSSQDEPGSGNVTPTPSSPSLHRFDWQQRPGIGSRNDSIVSRSDYGGPRTARRGSAASTVSSIGGVLDIAGQGEYAKGSTNRDLGHNAISTLLQPPIVRTGLIPHTALPTSTAIRPPSIRDIPPVTLTTIPHIEPATFEPYLSQVGPLYEAKAEAEGEEQNPAWLRQNRAGSRDEGNGLIRSPGAEIPRSRMGSRQSSVSMFSPVESPAPRRRSSGGILKSRLTVAPLSSIPGVYFDDNFHLENPRTFDVVSERSEVIRSPQPQINEEVGRLGNGTAGQIPTIAAPRKALATNAILQEKLSFYLDTVEIHLIASISTASKSFFAALGSLKGLHSEAAESVTSIQKLRQDLANLDEKMALGGLEIIAMKQRQQNLQKLADAVQQLQYVLNGASHCGDLVEEGDFGAALHRIGILEEFTCGSLDPKTKVDWLCKTRPPHLLDLRRLKCLDGFAEGMDQLRVRIGRGYELQFLNILMGDLRRHVGSVPTNDTLSRWTHTSNRSRGLPTPAAKVPSYMETDKKLRQELSVILHGLGQSKYTAVAAKSFWDEIMKEMKGLIRQNLPSSTDDDAESTISVSTNRSRTTSRQEKSQILARNLHALDPEDAEAMFSKVYCSISEALRRLQTLVKLLLDVTSGSAFMSPPSSPPRRPQSMINIDDSAIPPPPPPKDDIDLQAQLMQALDMSNLLGQAVDVAQTQITRVLRVRTDETVRLSLRNFLRYFTLNKLFADECEAITGRPGAALRGIVDGQIKDFISTFAEAERQDLAETMEKDRWDALDFSNDDNIALNQLVQAMQVDPDSWLQQANLVSNRPTASYTNGSSNGTNGISRSSTPLPADSAPTEKPKASPISPATLDEESYLLTRSAIDLLHGLTRFMSLLTNLPRLCPEISASITDYIRLFTSRTNQLVLFAGATKSAGLERINTKHLALASRVLGFAGALLPYVREFVRRKAGAAGGFNVSSPGGAAAPNTTTQSLMTSFDSVRKGAVNAQISVHEKLASIMSARARTHVQSLRKIDFDAQGVDEQRSGKASPYMETLTKETITLHRVLSKHLPYGTVSGIMREVFDNYKETLGEGYKAIELSTEKGRQKMLDDVGLFETKMLPLDRSGDEEEDRMRNGEGPASEAAGFLMGMIKAKPLVGGGPAVAASAPPRTSLERPNQPASEAAAKTSSEETRVASTKEAECG